MVKDHCGLHNRDIHSSNGTAQMRAEVFEAGGTANASLAPSLILSVVIRFHNKERLPFLDQALFSLAIQYWHDLETIVVIQNGTDEMKDAVIDLIERQPWPTPPRYKVLSCEIPEGVDGRSSLLNYGVSNASGRYLAFLDDDDVVYQHGYTVLIRQLIAGGCAIAMGGCRTARNEYKAGHWFVKIKESPFTYGRTRLDLFTRNFVPIHSYVIDRARTGTFDLWFDDELPPVEDYDFLLRLCAAFEPDFSKLDTPVCEYRFHGANSTPYDVAGTGLAGVPGPSLDKALRSMAKVDERKKQYTCSLPVSELAELTEALAGLRNRLKHLQSDLELERARITYRVARIVTQFVDEHPSLAQPIKLVKSSLKIIRH